MKLHAVPCLPASQTTAKETSRQRHAPSSATLAWIYYQKLHSTPYRTAFPHLTWNQRQSLLSSQYRMLGPNQKKVYAEIASTAACHQSGGASLSDTLSINTNSMKAIADNPITLVGKICKHAKQSRRSKTLQRRPSTPLQIIIADEGLIKQETSLMPASDHSVVSYLPRSTSFCLRPCQSTAAATVWDIGHSRSPLDGSPRPILLEHDRVGTALQQEKHHVYCTSSTPYAATACSIIGSTIALTPVPTTIVMVGHKQRRLIQDLVTTPSHLELDDMFNGGGIVCENSATKYLDDTTVEFSHPPGYSGIQSGAGRLTHANSYDDIAKIGSLKATPSMRLDEFLENTLFAGLDTPYDMRYEQGCPSEMTVPSLQY